MSRVMGWLCVCASLLLWADVAADHDAAGLARRDDRRQRRSPAGQHDVVAGHRQHRSAPDGGTAAAGTQLDRPLPDGEGVTANNAGNTPGAADDQFQLNLDGQQITQRVAGSGFGQPKVSREAIAEFQIVTNMFDITQGRSTGMQVQAISRSGTNDFRASTYGYFRSDKFNAADPIRGTVLPFENEQVGGTAGGPIIRDRMHFFGSYEYERQPADAFLAPTRLPNQTFEFQTKPINQNYLGRLDTQFSHNSTLSVRGQRWLFSNPFSIGSGTAHPSTADNLKSFSTNYNAVWSRALSNNAMLQVQGGINRFSWYNDAQPFVDVPFHNMPFFVPEFDFPA